jgi:hypothetical protein
MIIFSEASWSRRSVIYGSVLAIIRAHVSASAASRSFLISYLLSQMTDREEPPEKRPIGAASPPSPGF